MTVRFPGLLQYTALKLFERVAFAGMNTACTIWQESRTQ